MMTNEERATLERLMDQYGPAAVLDEMGVICLEKSDHIRASYSPRLGQDDPVAKVWRRMARSCHAASARFAQLGEVV